MTGYDGARSAAESGFTLIEIIIAIAIVAILVTAGIPSYQSTIASNRAASTTNEFVSHIRYARTEAIKENERVTLCPVAEGADQCLTDADTKSWASGIAVFIEAPGGTVGKIDAGDEVLRINRFSTGGVITPLPDADGTRAEFITFSGNTLNLDTALNFAGTDVFRVCDVNDYAAPRVVTVMGSGWPQLLTDRNGDDVITGVPGSPKGVRCDG